MNKNIVIDTSKFTKILEGYLKYRALVDSGFENMPEVEEAYDKFAKTYYFDDENKPLEERLAEITQFEFGVVEASYQL